MSYQAYLIAPFRTGLDTDMARWMLPEDAFSEVINGHIHHGILEKRLGYSLLAYFPHNNGSNWDVSNITQANPGVVTVTSTTGLSNGDEIVIRGAGGMTEVNGNLYVIAGLTGTTFQLNDTAGNTVNTSAFTAYTSGGAVDLIPGNRMMGISLFIDSGGGREQIAFDTRRAARFNTTSGQYDPLDAADIFSSDDTNYVWTANWASTASTAASTLYRLYFTNGKSNAGGATDGIRYYDPAVSTTATTQYNPNINSSTELRGCKLIFAIRQRLLILHTFEGANSYPQRARWCEAQNPNASDAWDDNVAGKGGYVDAPTGDQIVSARFIQDNLVVFFTNSVWLLRPVGDPALPFRWEKINDFKATQARMGTIGFDSEVFTIGTRGITATDGTQTRRIDNRIEDFVNDEVNPAEFDKCFGARDFAQRRSWLLYPCSESDEADRALIFDEDSRSWGKYDIDLNVLGYGAQQQRLRWSDFPFDPGTGLITTFADATPYTWQSFYQTLGDELFLGGDRNGRVYVLENGTSDNGDPISFEIQSAAWNPYSKEGTQAQFGYLDLYMDSSTTDTLTVEFFKSNETSSYLSTTIDMLPDVRQIAAVTNIVIKSPATSGVTVTAGGHGLSDGDIVYIYSVMGMVSINGGPYTVANATANTFDIAIDATGYNAYSTGGVVCLNPAAFTKTWKRIYCGGIGFQHTIKISNTSSNDPVRIHAFLPWFRPAARRLI